MKSKIIRFNEGYTYEYLIPVVFVLFFDIAFIVLLWPVGVSIALVALAFLLVKSGIEIDLKNKRLRNTHSFLGYVKGKWIKMDEFRSIKLTYTNESRVVNTRYFERTIKTVTYDMKFVFKNGRSIEFHEFTSYPLAKKVFELIENNSDAECIDLIEEIQKISLEKRKLKIKRKRAG